MEVLIRRLNCGLAVLPYEYSEIIVCMCLVAHLLDKQGSAVAMST